MGAGIGAGLAVEVDGAGWAAVDDDGTAAGWTVAGGMSEAGPPARCAPSEAEPGFY